VVRDMLVGVLDRRAKPARLHALDCRPRAERQPPLTGRWNRYEGYFGCSAPSPRPLTSAVEVDLRLPLRLGGSPQVEEILRKQPETTPTLMHRIPRA
jgi:hypothetical protein